MIRDEELIRLTKYAQGMGIKVTFSSSNQETASADWTTDGSAITIYKNTNATKIEKILSLIHELGHHLHFVHEKNREPDLKFDEALDTVESIAKEGLPLSEVSIGRRKKILDIEKAGTKYWEIIYKDTNLKFPIYKLYVAMDYDMYQYETYYELGRFPKQKENRIKLKELTLKYRDKKYD